MLLQDNFIEKYLDYFKDTEPPTIYHRWGALVGIAALLGRQAWIVHGHDKIFPNLYVMLVGESGARKGTVVNNIKRFLTAVDYKKFSANRTSKEKFLVDLQGKEDEETDEPMSKFDVRSGASTSKKHNTIREMFGEELSNEPCECFIAVDEFNVFLGQNNSEFISILTELWGYNGAFTDKIKTGKSVRIFDPTVNILGGNTNVGISMAFPTETIGQGFFSRLLMVYSDPTGRRITFPPVPEPERTEELVKILWKIKTTFKGEIPIEPHANQALDEIYQSWTELDDPRFRSYSQRRLTNLFKLCLVCAAAQGNTTIDVPTVVYANSILHYTESFMPKALGEFGKARNSDVTAKVLDIIDKAERPLDINRDIYVKVRRDLDNTKQLADILRSLAAAGKIQNTAGGILPRKTQTHFNHPHCQVILLQEYVEAQGKTGEPL